MIDLNEVQLVKTLTTTALWEFCESRSGWVVPPVVIKIICNQRSLPDLKNTIKTSFHVISRGHVKWREALACEILSEKKSFLDFGANKACCAVCSYETALD